MKLLSLSLTLLLACSISMAASSKSKRVVADDDDDATPTLRSSTRTSKASNPLNFRRIMPQIGLSLSDETINNTSMKAGFQGGVTTDLLGSNKWVMETGLLYKQMGASIPIQTGTETWYVNYLQVPILAKYYFLGQAGTTFYGKGGFVPGINVSHSESGDPTGNNDLSGINTFDLEFLLGVGGKLELSK